MFQSRAGVSAEALPLMSPSSALSPPLISGRRNPASHTLNIRKSTVMLTPSFIPTTISSGALNKEGETVLKQIIRFASKREGITHTVYAARAWARLSSRVQAASAQQILNRDFVDWSEVADVFD